MTPSKTEHELEELLRARLALVDMLHHYAFRGKHTASEAKAIDGAWQSLRDALPALLAERKRLREAVKRYFEAQPTPLPGSSFIVTEEEITLRSLLAEQEATDERA